MLHKPGARTLLALLLTLSPITGVACEDDDDDVNIQNPVDEEPDDVEDDEEDTDVDVDVDEEDTEEEDAESMTEEEDSY